MPRKVIDVKWDCVGTFVERPNRFLAVYDVKTEDGSVLKKEKVHVHDPGRLLELCYPGNKALLKRASGEHRKTKWDLLAAWTESGWVFIHSAYHRYISEWVLNSDVSPFGEVELIKPEFKAGHSRLDFLLTKPDGSKTAVEVKGCSLAIDGVALFPDAPTERGRRHINTLMELRETDGYTPAVMILVFRPDAKCFRPKADTDPKFAATFYDALENGLNVHLLQFQFNKEKKSIEYLGTIEVCQDQMVWDP